MALDQRIGLVGRDEPVALIEYLLRARPRLPLPVVVAFGPGGSGKSALLDHVARRYRAWPVSRVNLDGMGSNECKDVLAAIVDDLRDYIHPEFGAFHLPRYRLARLAMATADEAAAEDTARQAMARDLLAVRLTKLPQVPQVLAAAAEMVPLGLNSALRTLQPVLRWLAGFGVCAPRWLRPLLVGRRLAAALRWYETVAVCDEHLEIPNRVKAPAVVVELWRRLHRSDRADQRRIDRLLVAAFLADIAAEFRPRSRRKATCLVLLDGADVLEPFADSLFQPSRGVSATPASNVVDLLAEARRAQPDVPLLVIATKQAQADGPGDTAAVAALRRYDTWRTRYTAGESTDMFLRLPLRPFTLNQTGQFLAEWSRTQDYPVADATLIRELHHVTKGHPLAVELAVRATGLRFRADNARPAVRDAFDRRLPEGQITAEPDMTIGDYLLFRFLQRFRGGEDIAERRRTQELLARLAAARRIDVETVRLLVPDRDPDDVLDRLRKYSFADTITDGGQDYLTLHPLLRDLLAQRLLADSGAYRITHRLLRNRYRSIRDHTEELYHSLALGEVDTVSRELRGRMRSDDRRWPTLLESVTQAPLAKDDRWLDRGRRRMRGAIHTVTPEIAAVHDLVLAAWRLRSATSTTAYLPRSFDQVADAYTAVGARMGRPTDPVIEDGAARYRRMASPASEHGRELAIAPLAGFASFDQRVAYPGPWLPRRVRTAIAVCAVVLLVAGYATGFMVQRGRYCDAAGPLDVPSVAGSFVDPTLLLAREDNGECVGLTTSATSFAYGDRSNPDSQTETEDIQEIAELSHLIYEQNQQVDQHVADGDRPAVTVVVATMLSTIDSQPYRDLTLGVNELRGAYLAQQGWNKFGGDGLPGFLVRLALANLGGDSAYATYTADRIKRYAQADPSVIAVTGMGQTRDQTLQAATVLGGGDGSWDGMPVVTTAPTGTQFEVERDVFMTAATDDRQTQVAVDYIRSRPELSRLSKFVVYDPSDPYSQELSDDYANMLTDDELPVTSYQNYTASQMDESDQIERIAGAVCGRSKAPLVIYVGRANELPTLVDGLTDAHCADHAVLFGDDDLTQTETHDFQDLKGRVDSDQLYYTTFAAACPDLTATDNPACQAKPFADIYPKDGQVAFRTGWNGELMLAYDAIRLTLNAAKQVDLPPGDVPTRRQVATQLEHEPPQQGTAGVIDFGPFNRAVPDAGRVDPNKQVVIEMLCRHGAGLTPVVVPPSVPATC